MRQSRIGARLSQARVGWLHSYAKQLRQLADKIDDVLALAAETYDVEVPDLKNDTWFGLGPDRALAPVKPGQPGSHHALTFCANVEVAYQ